MDSGFNRGVRGQIGVNTASGVRGFLAASPDFDPGKPFDTSEKMSFDPHAEEVALAFMDEDGPASSVGHIKSQLAQWGCDDIGFVHTPSYYRLLDRLAEWGCSAAKFREYTVATPSLDFPEVSEEDLAPFLRGASSASVLGKGGMNRASFRVSSPTFGPSKTGKVTGK